MVVDFAGQIRVIFVGRFEYDLRGSVRSEHFWQYLLISIPSSHL